MTEEVPETAVITQTAPEKLATHIAKKRGDKIISACADGDGVTVTVVPDLVPATIGFIRDDNTCACQQLMDITAVDYPAKAQRFEVVYHLLSLTKNHRIRVKTAIDDDQAVPSIVELYPTANWFEREVWDMYGVPFDNHPDLRRILTDYGFDGHPLRKDFPLTGFVELRYDAQQKRCVYEPVKLTQDFRTFDFLSPWEGMTDVQLPGDEKAVKPKFNPLDDTTGTSV